jgi:exodeoxyribonuclease X
VHHISLASACGTAAFDAGDDVRATAELRRDRRAQCEFETKFFTSPAAGDLHLQGGAPGLADAPSHSNGALRYWLEDQGKIAPDHALTQPAHRAGPTPT